MRRLLALTTLAVIAVAAPADAHVQVRPAQAAPGDAVLWEVLVPNERDAPTTQVSLQIPRGVLPFAYESTPGWTRTVEDAADGSAGVVRWRGRLGGAGFVRFAFLAATPDQESPLAWKAVQRYGDGTEVAWIGGPDSEEPAAVTTVSRRFPRQNAGGEGEVASSVPVAAVVTEDDADWPPLALGGAGLALGAIALAVALTRRRPAALTAASPGMKAGFTPSDDPGGPDEHAHP